MLCTPGFRDPGEKNVPGTTGETEVKAKGPWGWASCLDIQKALISLVLAGAVSIPSWPW